MALFGGCMAEPAPTIEPTPSEKKIITAQIEPTATKQIKSAPITQSTHINNQESVLFTISDQYKKFPVHLQNAFENIADVEFSAMTQKAGMSVAIYADSTLWNYATGKASELSEMTIHTPLMISSTSKTVLSALVLTQIENGLYKLEDTLGSTLSGDLQFQSFNPTIINADVTIQELLTMSSGLGNYNHNVQGKIELIRKSHLRPADLIKLITSPYNPPGMFEYNDTNVVLLGMVAEWHSDQRLANLYRQIFFEPLSISAITLPEEGIEWNENMFNVVGDNFTDPHMAMPYTDISKWASGFGNMIDAAPFGFGYYIGAMGRTRYACCGIVSTPSDIARWGYELYSDNGKAISKAVRAQLKNSTDPSRIPPWASSEHFSNSSEEYGYLTSKKNIHSRVDKSLITSTYGHPGGGSGYSGWLHYSPELDLSVSIITNSQSNSLGTCNTAKPGDCMTMGIMNKYKNEINRP
jgi:CubicO group peptidase (beta-lactamase class C family)